MTLRKNLNEIFEKKAEAVLVSKPESTPCWEWISKKFEATANRLKKEQHIIMTFTIFSNPEEVMYFIGTDKTTIDSSRSLKKFTKHEIMECIPIAKYNRLSVKYTVSNLHNESMIELELKY